jgi:hypothetical protein
MYDVDRWTELARLSRLRHGVLLICCVKVYGSYYMELSC